MSAVRRTAEIRPSNAMEYAGKLCVITLSVARLTPFANLCLSQIKSGYIGGAARRELGGKECARSARRRARPAYHSHAGRYESCRRYLQRLVNVSNGHGCRERRNKTNTWSLRDNSRRRHNFSQSSIRWRRGHPLRRAYLTPSLSQLDAVPCESRSRHGDETERRKSDSKLPRRHLHSSRSERIADHALCRMRAHQMKCGLAPETRPQSF